ncbi:C40 family peptidase [Mycolicibacterium houstonense]|uniref:C40 family peptidase n=1 Tax=Mycolicibacterium houstonense TaxID=146021 RepID=UPI0021F37835|nr:C40 family peptidase [Mycolicibacterium houstonense]
MSLDALVAEAGQVLGDARKMFGPAPTAGGWSSTPALSAGKDSLAQAGGVLAGWGGASATTHLSASGGRVVALDNVIGADRGTAPGFTGAAQTSQSGGGGMDDVNADTRRGVAAIAPSTDTPAGKTQLVNHLQSQLDRAKALLKVSESRNVMLANAIRSAAGGYGGGMPMGGGMGGPMGGGMPMGGGGMGGGGLPGLGGAGLIPNLSAFTRKMGGGMPMGGGGMGGGGLPGLGGAGLIPNLSAFTRSAGFKRSGPGGTLGGPGTPALAGSGGGPLAQSAVKAALSKRGTPYVWGAKGPNVFDCSGLTQWAWRQAGVTLGPDTYSQVKQGLPVAPGDVQEGDIIFPKGSWDDRGPGHVMLAISPTQVVHAPQTGDVVKVAPMPADFVARRPVAA